MELKEGMYVRSKYGIAKYVHKAVTKVTIYRIVDKNIVYDNEENWQDSLLDNEIIKASNNIIDLIEYGDFITLGENNYPLQVRNVWEHAGDIHIELSNGAKFEDLHNNKDFKIYSIVTKEQFEAMEYKID